jgi:hypothetical protein
MEGRGVSKEKKSRRAVGRSNAEKSFSRKALEYHR